MAKIRKVLDSSATWTGHHWVVGCTIFIATSCLTLDTDRLSPAGVSPALIKVPHPTYHLVRGVPRRQSVLGV